MATNEPDSEMDHEYDQIIFPKVDIQESKMEVQSSQEFAISTPQGAGLYPQLLRQLLHENDWGKHPVYKMQVLQEQEKAIAAMNIPPVELLKQVQGGDVYVKQSPIRSYEDAVMATAFMPAMFNEEEAIPEPRIREKTVSPVKKAEAHMSSSTDSETEQKQTVRKSVPKYGKKAQSYRLSKSMFDRIKMFKKHTGEGVVCTFSEPEHLNAAGLSSKSTEIVTKPTETDI